MLATLSKDSVAFRKTILLLQEPLSHPNSRYRNEDLYIKLLQAQLNSPWYIDAAKEAAKNKLQLVMQNRKGNPANDFTYITPGGLKKRMYAINADHLILFFYNPECQACKEMKEALERSELVKSKLKTKKLKILAVYIDKDEALWRKHLNEMPEQWVVGRDENEFLYRNNVYDLKAIPTVYLLTKEKKVLLKDCMDLSLIEKNLDSKTEH